MIAKLLSGTGILVAMYLILNNASGSVSVINALGNVYSQGVSTLQGR